jgi:hypothetical protein
MDSVEKEELDDTNRYRYPLDVAIIKTQTAFGI